MGNKELNHGDRSHAKYSPSGMGRILACPASIVLSEGLPEGEQTKASLEGTQAHEIAENITRSVIEGYLEIEVATQEEMYAFEYAKYIKSIIEGLDNSKYCTDLEERVFLTEDCWGTVDCIIYNANTLHIIDYKYGLKEVKAEQNKQLLTYACAAIGTFELSPKYVYLHIYQPRIEESLEDYIPSVWRAPIEEIKEHKKNILKTIELIEKGSIDLEKHCNVGEHCFFCRAKQAGVCRKYQEVELANIQEEFADVLGLVEAKDAKISVNIEAKDFEKPKLAKKATKDILELGLISDEKLAFLAANKAKIINFLESASEYYISQLEDAKKPIPNGYELEHTYTNRKWIDDEEALINALKERGIDEPTEVKVKPISITKAEKLVGKGMFDDLVQDKEIKGSKLVKLNNGE